MYFDATKVKIVDCHDSKRWYADKIGEEFHVSYWGKGEVYVKTQDSYNTGNFILAKDLEVVK